MVQDGKFLLLTFNAKYMRRFLFGGIYFIRRINSIRLFHRGTLFDSGKSILSNLLDPKD